MHRITQIVASVILLLSVYIPRVATSSPSNYFAPLLASDVENGRATVEALMHNLASRSDASVFNAEIASDSNRSADPAGQLYVQTLLRLLHARQHPPQSECRSTRLLLVKSPEISYEGLGSVLSLLALGLAEAMYSNRTLVWGAELTPLLDLSRTVWTAPNPSARGVALDCARADRGGGAYSCFFEPLSACSLADASPAELVALRSDCFSDLARLKIVDHRRSFVAYMAPPGVPMSGPEPRWKNHLWYGALASYVFRLQPSVRAAFEATRSSLSGGRWATDTACAHVRHGDVRSVSGPGVPGGVGMRGMAPCAPSCAAR